MNRAYWILIAFLTFLSGCSPLKRMTVLIQMAPDQEFNFKSSILRNYERKTSIKVNVIKYDNVDSIESYLKKYSGKINLVNIPFDKGSLLMNRGYFKPLDSFLNSEELRFFTSNYLLSSFGMVDGRATLIPRHFETQLLVYSKSMVKDAIQKWPQLRDEINNEVKKYNGFGLPVSYNLESDPNKWDYYDILVIGLIWVKSSHDEIKGGRIAYAGGGSNELAIRIEDCVTQLNGDSSNIIKCKGDPVIDAMHWEAVYAASGIYHKYMFNSTYGRVELMKGFASGQIFLGIMSQLDYFSLHGTGHEDSRGMLKNPSDIAVALIPSACSVELDDRSEPVRVGTRSIRTSGWWWAIPYNASSIMLSYRLAGFITDTSSQLNECTHYGLIPVRKEVLSNMAGLVKEPWMKDAFEVAFRQLVHNGTASMRDYPNSEKIRTLYIDLWYTVIGKRMWADGGGMYPDRNYIKHIIESQYAPRALKF